MKIGFFSNLYPCVFECRLLYCFGRIIINETWWRSVHIEAVKAPSNLIIQKVKNDFNKQRAEEVSFQKKL